MREAVVSRSLLFTFVFIFSVFWTSSKLYFYLYFLSSEFLPYYIFYAALWLTMREAAVSSSLLFTFVFIFSVFCISSKLYFVFCIFVFTFVFLFSVFWISSKLYFVCCPLPHNEGGGSQQQPSFQMKTQKSCCKITSHWKVVTSWKITSHTWSGGHFLLCLILSSIVGCFFDSDNFWEPWEWEDKYKYEWSNKGRWERKGSKGYFD